MFLPAPGHSVWTLLLCWGSSPPTDGRQRLLPVIISRNTWNGGGSEDRVPASWGQKEVVSSLWFRSLQGLGAPLSGPRLLTLSLQPSGESLSYPVSYQ